MPTLTTYTIGCKVNQYETEYLRQGLAQVGYRPAKKGEVVDLCIVNTCTVTSKADMKSRKAIRQFARRHPDAEIIVMGCYATRAAEELASLPGVVRVVDDKQQLPSLLAEFGVKEIPDGIQSFQRHRAHVKVQDGCKLECSYCIIPKCRPILSSRPVDSVISEVNCLVHSGHREIVLTGIHLGHYGIELPKNDRPDLAQLVRRVTDLEGEFRVRLSSLEAEEVSSKLIEIISERPDRVCPHLHLSMQSGSDSVLQRMRRRYCSKRFVQQCDLVKQALDAPSITTDVIVGFPGETDSDFEETCRVVEEVGFSKIHIFRFSAREGTPAATMPNQVPKLVQRQRAAELAKIERRLRKQYMESLVGRSLQVLVETRSKSQADRVSGTAGRYLPVEFAGNDSQIGTLASVRAERTGAGCIEALPSPS